MVFGCSRLVPFLALTAPHTHIQRHYNDRKFCNNPKNYNVLLLSVEYNGVWCVGLRI